jgi:hypothetical protein
MLACPRPRLRCIDCAKLRLLSGRRDFVRFGHLVIGPLVGKHLRDRSHEISARVGPACVR